MKPGGTYVKIKVKPFILFSAEAQLEAKEGDKELLTALLLKEMVNKVVCQINHKRCTHRVGCRRGFHVYLDEEEKKHCDTLSGKVPLTPLVVGPLGLYLFAS